MKIPNESHPYWRIPGVVVECRELRSKKDDSIWAYSVKVLGMGGVYDIQTRDAGLFGKTAEGMNVVAEGRFEQFNGGIKLVATAFSDSK